MVNGGCILTTLPGYSKVSPAILSFNVILILLFGLPHVILYFSRNCLSLRGITSTIGQFLFVGNWFQLLCYPRFVIWISNAFSWNNGVHTECDVRWNSVTKIINIINTCIIKTLPDCAVKAVLKRRDAVLWPAFHWFLHMVKLPECGCVQAHEIDTGEISCKTRQGTGDDL